MKKIKYKRYRIYRLILVMIITALMSSFVILGNFIASLAVFAGAFILMFFLNKKVGEITTDERINQIAGRASRIVMVVSVLMMSVAGIVLVSLRNAYPQYWLIGNILLYFECGMMLLYSVLFRIFSKKI